MKNKRITASDVDNILTEDFLYKRLKLLAINMIEWEGLEDYGIEERHVEEFLFGDGVALGFEDPELGKMILQAQPCSMLNVHGDPLKWRAVGYGYSKEFDADKCVLIENNKLRLPTDTVIRYFTRQLYEIVRTRDVNVKTLKLPFVLPATDKTSLTLKQILEDIDNNVYAIVTDKSVVDVKDMVQVLPTGAKPFTNELTDLYHDVLNEALTYLGINNANTDKRERLINAEANANNQFIESCAQMFLESRQRACDKLNEMFGTNLKVKLRNGGQDETNLLQEYSTRTEQSEDPRA